MRAAQTFVLPVQLTPEAIESLRAAARLSPADIDLIADALAAKMRAAPAGLSVKAFALKYGCSESHVHRLINAKKLASVRVGGTGRRLIPVEAEVAWASGAP